MARRRRTVSRRKRKSSNTEYEDGLPAPNHLVPNVLPTLPANDVPASLRYPLTRLQIPESPGGGMAGGLAFVDPIYGLKRWVDREPGAPPTWMDPEIFVRMVVTDPRVEKLFEGVESLGTTGQSKLSDLLDEIFDECYLVYVYEQFEEVRPLLLRWIRAYFTTGKRDSIRIKHKD